MSEILDLQSGAEPAMFATTSLGSARFEKRPAAHAWVVVLAAGAGNRLRSLTLGDDGIAVPKQFCSLRGGRSLLACAIERARRLVPSDRIAVVVAREHARWWMRELADVPASNIFVQPDNRGTAPGILLPVLAILERDPSACVAILPSDHHVRREQIFSASLQRACAALERDVDTVTLLGITPDAAEIEYGWIVPLDHATRERAKRVARFVEKPAPELAASLMRQGALWNSFVFTARASVIVGLFEKRLPDIVDAFRARRSPRDLDELYARIPEADFSRSILQGSESSLRLRRVPECGWTDLGTPQRVAQCLAVRARAVRPDESARVRAALDLSRALLRSAIDAGASSMSASESIGRDRQPRGARESFLRA